MIPQGFNLTGTCGDCGGPLLQKQTWTSYGTNDSPPPEVCGNCGKHVAPTEPTYGPIKQMKAP